MFYQEADWVVFLISALISFRLPQDHFLQRLNLGELYPCLHKLRISLALVCELCLSPKTPHNFNVKCTHNPGSMLWRTGSKYLLQSWLNQAHLLHTFISMPNLFAGLFMEEGDGKYLWLCTCQDYPSKLFLGILRSVDLCWSWAGMFMPARHCLGFFFPAPGNMYKYKCNRKGFLSSF